MTRLDLVRTADGEVVGSLTLRTDGAVDTDGAATPVWRTMRRLADSDRDLFDRLAADGWSNGPLHLRRPDRDGTV